MEVFLNIDWADDSDQSWAELVLARVADSIFQNELPKKAK